MWHQCHPVPRAYMDLILGAAVSMAASTNSYGAMLRLLQGCTVLVARLCITYCQCMVIPQSPIAGPC